MVLIFGMRIKIRILLTVLGIVWIYWKCDKGFHIYEKRCIRCIKCYRKEENVSLRSSRKKQQICCELGQKNNIDIVKHKGIKIPMAYGIFIEESFCLKLNMVKKK